MPRGQTSLIFGPRTNRRPRTRKSLSNNLMDHSDILDLKIKDEVFLICLEESPRQNNIWFAGRSECSRAHSKDGQMFFFKNSRPQMTFGEEHLIRSDFMRGPWRVRIYKNKQAALCAYKEFISSGYFYREGYAHNDNPTLFRD